MQITAVMSVEKKKSMERNTKRQFVTVADFLCLLILGDFFIFVVSYQRKPAVSTGTVCFVQGTGKMLNVH